MSSPQLPPLPSPQRPAHTPASPKLPRIPTTELRVKDTHRLIASKYSETGTVLSRLSANSATLSSLLELDDATNDRFLGEEGLLPGIGIHELVYGIRYAHIVNAAFTHASPAGGRFNSPTRGAWYASLDRQTSVAEVAFHKLRAIEEIDWPHEEISTFDDYLADITSPFHDLRTLDLRTPDLRNTSDPGSQRPAAGDVGWTNPASPGHTPSPAATSLHASSEKLPSATEPLNSPAHRHESPFARYLLPDPIPRCYARPQRLAGRLLTRKSNGIIYPSVRRPSGTCLVVFRPALVYNVRRGARLELRLHPNRPFRTSQAREVPIPQP